MAIKVKSRLYIHQNSAKLWDSIKIEDSPTMRKHLGPGPGICTAQAKISIRQLPAGASAGGSVQIDIPQIVRC
jgi:hypothetical protein